jgi:hypothetical protein
MARKVVLIDRGPENRQHGNKPYFTGVSLSFSAGNTAAAVGNILLVFLSRHSEATADRHSPPQKLYKYSHLLSLPGFCPPTPPATVLQTLIINDLGCYKGATIWLFCSTCSTLARNICRYKPKQARYVNDIVRLSRCAVACHAALAN